MSLKITEGRAQEAIKGGVLTATLTPLHDDLSINHTLLADHCTELFNKGSHGIALFGTTGEANSFTIEERVRALEALCELQITPSHLIVGTGCCALPDAVRLTRHATNAGVGGVLVLPPFYYKQVSDHGLYEFFSGLIEEVGMDTSRIFLYHFPRMSGLGFSKELIGRLLDEYPEQIVGIKDSSGDLEHMIDIQQSFPHLKVFAGTEKLLLPILNAGGAGCISATANVSVRLARQVFDAFSKGLDTTKINTRMCDVREAFEGLPFTGALKCYLAAKSKNPSWKNIRPPNTVIDESDLESIMKQVGNNL